MKKSLFSVLIIITLSLVSACSKNTNYDYEKLANEVIEIKIVHVVQEWDSLEYDILVEIDQKNNDIFLLELSKLDFIIPVFGDRGDLSDETCVMLVYENGDFDLISQYLTVKYHANNEPVTWDPHVFDKLDEFNQLIDRYI